MGCPMYQFSFGNTQRSCACLFLGMALSVSGGVRGDDAPAAPTNAEPSVEAKSPSEIASDSGPTFDWTKVPPVRPTPRLGMFVIFPTDAGYYSLWGQLRGDYKEKAPNSPWGTYGFTPG